MEVGGSVVGGKNKTKQNHHPFLTESSEAPTAAPALSAARVLIKPGRSRKMKRGHLLSQHAVGGVVEERGRWCRGVGGRGGQTGKKDV